MNDNLSALESDLLQISYPNRYTDEDIQDRLSNLPRLKYAAGEKVVLAYAAMLEAKQSLEIEEAKAHLEARKDDKLTSEADRKQWAKCHPDVIDAQNVHIAAQGDYKSAEMRHEAIDDLFTAVRKLASMRLEQNKAQEAAERYGRPDDH